MNPPIYTRSKIIGNLEQECRISMLHASIGLSKLMVHVQQVEESRKRKHTREGNRSRQVKKNFPRKSSTEIMDKTGLGRDSPTKGTQVLPRVAMIGIPSPKLRETVK